MNEIWTIKSYYIFKSVFVEPKSFKKLKRTKNAKDVHIIYRRTREYMPAEPEEIRLAIADGIEFLELLSPTSYDGKTLEVQVMKLAQKGEDGRREVKPTGQVKKLSYNTVISATGSKVNTKYFAKNNIEQIKNHYAKLDDNNQTNIKNVYIAGDCKKGASTVVKAVADSKKIAIDILRKLGLPHDFIKVNLDLNRNDIRQNRAILKQATNEKEDGYRCLNCDKICEICSEVCPNRANITIIVNGKPQIIHIDGMCNECGNCSTFCPHTGNPYKDKLTLFWSKEGFKNSTNKGILFVDDKNVIIRNEKDEEFVCSINNNKISNDFKNVINSIKHNYPYMII